MQIHLLSSRSSASQADTGHPHDLPHDLSKALRAHGHQVEIDLLGDTLHGQGLTSLREGATAGRKIAARLDHAGSVLHALDPVAWAAALTARSLTDVSVVLRLSEAAQLSPSTRFVESRLSETDSGAAGRLGSAGDSGGGSGRVSTIGTATERRAYRACLRAADAIAATDDGDRLAAVRVGVSDERALIVPDLVSLEAEVTDPVSMRPGKVLLSVSGIGQDSGIRTLLAAVRRVPGHELAVIGPGNAAEAAAFRAALEQFDLADRVHWLGRRGRAETLRLIDSAAVVVLPSPTIGMTAAIEAMSRSRAVATVDGGIAAEVVLDGITGAVVAANRPDLLAQALRRLLSNPFQLEAMGLAGRERALARYAPARAISATEQAYRVALGAA
jgi:glycosyltransferase involved in cell wall biosynthesis